MFKLATVGAVTILALVAPLPAFAQAAVSEPGLAAFYHPNADVLRAGPGAYNYGGPPVYGSPYDANAYGGGAVVVEETYPYARSSRPVHHRSRVPQY